MRHEPTISTGTDGLTAISTNPANAIAMPPASHGRRIPHRAVVRSDNRPASGLVIRPKIELINNTRDSTDALSSGANCCTFSGRVSTAGVKQAIHTVKFASPSVIMKLRRSATAEVASRGWSEDRDAACVAIDSSWRREGPVPAV